MIRLQSCPKAHSLELDKAKSPADTVAHVRQRLQSLDLDILSSTTRVDMGRLGIPVFLSNCGADARRIMPTRKQMGKGASPIQAEASALMELMERFAFFSFWQDLPQCVTCTWAEAKEKFGEKLLPIEHTLQAVQDDLAPEKAEELLNLLPWQFFPVTDLVHQQEVWAPLNWFKKLGEFNGTSAGNTEEESLLQGLCELVERHVCCLIDRELRPCPTIDPKSIDDPTLQELMAAFERENITLILKDFSLNMPVPTVGAVAYDMSTFPQSSEIVFTAGTAASPAKAAIRAVTEVAQLGGDFCTSACYEASGLTKFEKLEDIQWLKEGPICKLSDLPSVVSDDILHEVQSLIKGLHALGYPVYAISTKHPQLEIPTHYCLVPGLAFRERDKNQSLGLFVGRILAEECHTEEALAGLKLLEEAYPKAHFIPFFQAMLALRQEDYARAHALFAAAEPLQPENDAKGLAAFYAGYSLTLVQQWQEALPYLSRAVAYCPDMKEYGNLRGVAHFKLQEYAKAAEDFMQVLRIDKGSVMDIANLGLCHKFLGNMDKAVHYLAAALELDPSLDFARTHLDEILNNK